MRTMQPRCTRIAPDLVGRGFLPGSLGLLMSIFSHPLFIVFSFFFFNDTATTEIYTLSLHDALPILEPLVERSFGGERNHSNRIVDNISVVNILVGSVGLVAYGGDDTYHGPRVALVDQQIGRAHV